MVASNGSLISGLMLLVGILIITCLALCLVAYKPPTEETFECPDCNVILISLDALRADHVGCYGYPRNTTPNIDSAAERGVVFENAFSQSPHTLSSHMSIFTSTYPTTHKVVLSGISHPLPEKILTLPQVLNIYGYNTAWFAPRHDPYLNLSAGFGRGINETHASPLLSDEGEEFLEWIKSSPGQRFFAFLHTYSIHSPYIPPEPLNKEFDPGYTGEMVSSEGEFLETIAEGLRQRYENDTGWFFSTLGIHDEDEKKIVTDFMYSPGRETFNNFSRVFIGRDIRPAEVLGMCQDNSLSPGFQCIYWDRVNLSDTRDMNHLIALYDAGILYSDQFLGKLFDRLDEAGISNRTIIVITADHGEEFMEHGYTQHTQLYDECIHVPLIFIVPGLESGIKAAPLVQSIDIMPTILDMLDIPVPSSAEGRSLLPAMKNGSEINDFVYSIWTHSSSVRNMEWKLVLHYFGTRELFHLPTDPGQYTNVAETAGETAALLESALSEWINKAELIPADNELLSRIDNETRELLIRTGYW